MSPSARPRPANIKKRVHRALDAWPDREAHRELLRLCTVNDREVLDAVGYALARCGRWRRDAAEDFLHAVERDRRLTVRTAVLFARAYENDESPRAFVREIRRLVALPGPTPWTAVMDELYWMWGRAPREMFRLMTPWLTHRDPWRRWAALHGLELPARQDPRAALKVLRLLRGERAQRVRRLLGHVWGQSLYPRHPEPALDEMARWLSEGARAARSVARQSESQVEIWFRNGHGTDRQRRSLRRVAREYLEHSDADVRAHARRLVALLED